MPKPSVETPKITAERRAVVKDRVELPRVYMAWITSPFFKPGDADADIAATVLGGGKSSRLYKTLVYDKQIAQTVSAQQYSLMLGSVFTIEATARPGHTAEELEKAIDEELDRFRDGGPEANEVERARNVIETRIVEGLENLGGFGGVADRLNMYNHYLGDPGYLPKDIERYRDVTPASGEGVRAGAARADSSRRRSRQCPVSRTSARRWPPRRSRKSRPGTGAESINADEAWRNDPPKAAEARAAADAACRSRSCSPNGLTVLVNERPGLPVVSERTSS